MSAVAPDSSERSTNDGYPNPHRHRSALRGSGIGPGRDYGHLVVVLHDSGDLAGDVRCKAGLGHGGGPQKVVDLGLVEETDSGAHPFVSKSVRSMPTVH